MIPGLLLALVALGGVAKADGQALVSGKFHQLGTEGIEFSYDPLSDNAARFWRFSNIRKTFIAALDSWILVPANDSYEGTMEYLFVAPAGNLFESVQLEANVFNPGIITDPGNRLRIEVLTADQGSTPRPLVSITGGAAAPPDVANNRLSCRLPATVMGKAEFILAFKFKRVGESQLMSRIRLTPRLQSLDDSRLNIDRSTLSPAVGSTQTTSPLTLSWTALGNQDQIRYAVELNGKKVGDDLVQPEVHVNNLKTGLNQWRVQASQAVTYRSQAQPYVLRGNWTRGEFRYQPPPAPDVSPAPPAATPQAQETVAQHPSAATPRPVPAPTSAPDVQENAQVMPVSPAPSAAAPAAPAEGGLPPTPTPTAPASSIPWPRAAGQKIQPVSVPGASAASGAAPGSIQIPPGQRAPLQGVAQPVVGTPPTGPANTEPVDIPGSAGGGGGGGGSGSRTLMVLFCVAVLIIIMLMILLLVIIWKFITQLHLPQHPSVSSPPPPVATQGHEPKHPKLVIPGAGHWVEDIYDGENAYVYRVTDQKNSFIIKILPLKLRIIDAAIRSLEEEGRCGKQLAKVPNFMKIHEIGVHHVQDNGASCKLPYLRMEDCGRFSLGQFRRNDCQDRVFAATVIHEVLRGLKGLAELKLVHKDLKPSNIMLNPMAAGSDYQVRVIDFGQMHRTRGLTGTPYYQSPEQLRQEALTPASDIFSLGLIYGELLLGRRVFLKKDERPQDNTSFTDEYNRRILKEEPDLGELDPEARAIVMKMLQKEPARRGRHEELLLLLNQQMSRR